MSLVSYAKSELARINTDNDPEQNVMDKHILRMVEEFANEGHTGFTAGYAIGILERLLRFLPLTPLTGEDDEWNNVGTEKGEELFQNKRCSAVFKRGDRPAFHLYGKKFSDDGGETWYTSRESRVEITFPYTVPTSPERVILMEGSQ